VNLLPPPGPERRRLVVMGVALVVIAAAYLKWGGTPELDIPTSTGPTPTAVPPRVQQRAQSGLVGRNAAPRPDTSVPQALKLAEMEQVPEEPQVGRNPFRFGVPPPPPQPKYTPPPVPTPTYTPPPPPQGPPPIPLKLTIVVDDPVQPGRRRAYLVYPKTGVTIEGIEGQVIDGQYRLLRVGTDSVVMSYLDGSGQRTINKGG
jgi:hypothetical protein